MSKEEITINSINDDIVKNVLKKVITPTSADHMAFDKLTFSKTKSGYGFSLEDGKKFLAVRSTEKLMVYINNSAADYKKNFLISDTKIGELTTKSSIEIYKKNCSNTIYTIIKTWLEVSASEKPSLGEWNLYKYKSY